MNSNISKLQKTGRIVLIFVRILQAVLLFSIAFNAYAGINAIGAETQIGMGDPVTSAIHNISISVLVFAALFIASAFLKAIRTEYTPFTAQNAARLKRIAILIAIIEPIGILINFISNMLRPVSADGFKTVIHSYMGGIVIVLGLIIFCIALIFDHGCHLQKQSDETL